MDYKNSVTTERGPNSFSQAKSYKKRTCIYIGEEPAEGYEGVSQPMNPWSKLPESYKVVDIGEREGGIPPIPYEGWEAEKE